MHLIEQRKTTVKPEELISAFAVTQGNHSDRVSDSNDLRSLIRTEVREALKEVQKKTQEESSRGSSPKNTKRRNNRLCYYCNKPGHIRKFCFKLKEDQAEAKEKQRLNES